MLLIVLDFLEKVLTLDPKKRMTVENGLAHPYVSAYHKIKDEPDHPKRFDFEFEYLNNVEDVKGVHVLNVLYQYAHLLLS